jgi:3D (Asp-Asp-Asp) domain-containing protein
MPHGHWAYGPVLRLRIAGVLSGRPEGDFGPEELISRAELLKMVLAARGLDTGNQCEGIFADVPCSAWYAPTVETAYGMAITEGRGDNSFAPDEPVTREQMVTIVIRAMGRRWDAAGLGWTEINAQLRTFSDWSTIDSWARPTTAYALKEGLTTGYEDGTFQPKALTTRAEAAALVDRIVVTPYEHNVLEIDGRKVIYTQERDMVASKYATGEPGVGTITYTGVTVRWGTVAVDPNVIPLGRLLYVEGYGYAVAADIGGAIKGERIDLFTHDYHLAAVEFGIQPRRVWVLP